jgi:hypothetical protein
MAKKPEDRKPNEIEQLFDAASRGATDLVAALLEKGVTPDCRDKMERTPLIAAAEAGKANVVQKLLDHGAKVNVVDVDGETALMAAAYGNHLDVVQLLVSRGADVNFRNKDGSTALELAQDMNAPAAATYLAAQSASTRVPEDTDASTELHDGGPTIGTPEAVGKAADGEDEANADSPAAPSIEVEDVKRDLPQEGSRDAASGPNEGDSNREFTKRIFESHAVMEPGLFPPLPVDLTNIPDVPPQAQAYAIKTIFGGSLEVGMEYAGRYIHLYNFKGDTQQVFSKRPNKGKRSLSEIARHLDGLITRQQLADCVRGAAFSQEAEASGLDVTLLSFSHKIALGRLKEASQRLNTAKEALENRYTVHQTRDRVRELMTGIPSEDRALGQAAIRKVGDILRLSTDKEMHAFLRDKDRLKSALKKADLLRMLDHAEDARKHIHTSVKLLEELEHTLVEITVPNRLTGQSDSGDEPGSDKDQSDEN